MDRKGIFKSRREAHATSFPTWKSSAARLANFPSSQSNPEKNYLEKSCQHLRRNKRTTRRQTAISEIIVVFRLVQDELCIIEHHQKNHRHKNGFILIANFYEWKKRKKEFMIFALNRNTFMITISRRAGEDDETHFNCRCVFSFLQFN